MTKMSYFAFGKGEPSGSDKRVRDCMFFYADEYYRFHAVPCDNFNGGYICEKESKKVIKMKL